MKKLLLIFVLSFTFLFIGCDTSQNTTNEIENTTVTTENILLGIEEQIADIEAKIALLEARLNGLVTVKGLNGQVLYYENEIKTLKLGLETLYNTFNPTLAPTYMYDINGDYINFSNLSVLIKNKYFSDVAQNYEQDRYEMTPFAIMHFYFEDSNIAFNDIIARIIIIVEEITNYEYYTLSSNGLKIDIVYSDGNYTHQIYFTIPTVVLINDMFTLNFDSIIGNQFESYFITPESYDIIDYDQVKIYYDNYKLNNTFDGYVLNYNG